MEAFPDQPPPSQHGARSGTSPARVPCRPAFSQALPCGPGIPRSLRLARGALYRLRAAGTASPSTQQLTAAAGAPRLAGGRRWFRVAVGLGSVGLGGEVGGSAARTAGGRSALRDRRARRQWAAPSERTHDLPAGGETLALWTGQRGSRS